MPIPMPSLSAIYREAKNGVPSAQLLCAALRRLREDIEDSDDEPYRLICADVREVFGAKDAAGGSKCTVVCAYCGHHLLRDESTKRSGWISATTHSQFCAAAPGPNRVHKPVAGEPR